MYFSRIELSGENVNEKGQQFVNGQGLHSHLFTKVHRIESHGIASEPVKGGKGLVIWVSPDEAYVVGGEHPDMRPTDLPNGGKAIYDSSGNIIKLMGNGVVMDFQSNTATFTSGPWTINVPTMTVNGNMQVNGNITCSGTITDSDGNNGA